MTRATLLHVLERPTALGPAEVRELEQLAQAFPYCQTAHLLLAKAAHDQGTMLAGQRLRRAATYAADRTLLRRLIEQQEPAELPAVPEPVVLPPAPHPLDLVDWPDEYVAPAAAPPSPGPARFVAGAAPTPVEALPPIAPPLALPPVAQTTEAAVLEAAENTAPAATPPTSLAEPVAPAEPAAEPTPEPALPAVAAPVLAVPVEARAAAVASTEVEATAVAGPETLPVTPVAIATPLPDAPTAHVAAETPLVLPGAEESTVTVAESAPDATAVAEVATPVAAVAPTSAEPTLLATLPELLSAPAPVAEGAAAPLVTEEASATALVVAVAAPADELPPQAPAIRPPVEVGEARFEFGLAEPTPAPAARTYELPGLVDEWAASAVTRSMGGPGALVPAAPVPAAPIVPAFTPAAFTGDAAVGYAFGESSRLGLSMQLLNLLAANVEAAGSATAVVAAAQPPASALPPTGTFFEPDPLLLDHWATHRPAPPELPSTVDLINNFLKRQPRLTRPAMLPPAAGGQADLSVRSTRAEPDLVSENLARIFVRQGKTARAIEIYEKLMVKQPEKMAYFAAQIQSLQPSA